MDRVDKILKSLETRKLRRTQQDNWDSWSKNYRWAKEFVYGVEKDYRLSKTAKVSCFLNGDGDANVICGDGLDHFSLCDKYKGKLYRQYQGEGEQDNQQFDVLVANPPYSVSSCKKTIKHGEKSFSLFPRLTDASSEIECLFIERAKQLLKTSGVAGILLPSSILSNGGIYEATREIILKYFEIKALAVMGSSTFMATGTSTVILFIKRRDNSDWQRIEGLINDFIVRWQDMTVAGRENSFALYAQTVWALSLDVYIAMLKGDAIPDHSLYREYRQDFDNLTVIRNLKGGKRFQELIDDEKQNQLDEKYRQYLLNAEKEKMLYFFLLGNQQVVISRAPGDKQSEKAFLGYEFSNSKGREGLKVLSNTGILQTALYSETESANPDKINTLIRNNFLGNDLAISPALAEYVTISSLFDLMTFDRVRFDKAIATTIKKKQNSRWPLIRLGEISEYLQRGKSPQYGNGTIQVIKSGQARGWRQFDFKTPHFLDAAVKSESVRLLLSGDLLINSTGVGTAGRVTLFDKDGLFTVDSHITILRPKLELASSEYILAALGNIGFSAIEKMATGQSGQIELSLDIIRNIEIPLPPLETQQQLAKECAKVDKAVVDALKKIETANESITNMVKDVLSQQRGRKRLSGIVTIISGGTPSTSIPEYWDGDIPWLTVADFCKSRRYVYKADKSISSKGLENSNTRYLQTGDLIISARGTVGAIAQLAVPMTFNQSCYGLRGIDGVDNGFLLYALRHEIAQLKDHAYGSTFSSITIKTFDNILIPLPALADQQRLVADIESLEKKVFEAQKIIDTAAGVKAGIMQKYLF